MLALAQWRARCPKEKHRRPKCSARDRIALGRARSLAFCEGRGAIETDCLASPSRGGNRRMGKQHVLGFLQSLSGGEPPYLTGVGHEDKIAAFQTRVSRGTGDLSENRSSRKRARERRVKGRLRRPRLREKQYRRRETISFLRRLVKAHQRQQRSTLTVQQKPHEGTSFQ